MPAGWIAIKFGGKWVFAITMLIATVATVLTPVMSNAHYGGLITMRVLLGIVTVSQICSVKFCKVTDYKCYM